MDDQRISVLAHPIVDAARMLGIGRTKLYELICAGEIKTIRLGARRLVPATELRRLVEERLQAAA